MGGTVQAGGSLADTAWLMKNSSDGFVKEALIWQHNALILLSPSPGRPISISSTRRKGKHRGLVEEIKEKKMLGGIKRGVSGETNRREATVPVSNKVRESRIKYSSNNTKKQASQFQPGFSLTWLWWLKTSW